MLAATGHDSMAALIARTVPKNILTVQNMDLPEAMAESAYLEHIDRISKKNTLYRNHIGMGYHTTEVPSVIRRNVLEIPVGIQHTPPIKQKSLRGGWRPC